MYVGLYVCIYVLFDGPVAKRHFWLTQQLPSGRYGASRILQGVHQIEIHTQTRLGDRPQDKLPAAPLSTHQCSSSTFNSSPFISRKEEIRRVFKDAISSVFSLA
jgi:hypothetical protein